MDNNNYLVRYFVNKGDIALPEILLKGKIISELNHALELGEAVHMNGLFNKIYSNFDEYFSSEDIDKTFEFIKEVENISKQDRFSSDLSEDDKKIIDFLVKNEGNQLDFLELAGPYYFILEVATEWGNNKNLPEIINAVIIMWLYVNSYEILLHQLDRKILNYLSRSQYKDDKKFKYFINSIKRKEYKDHSSADDLNGVLSNLLNMDENNSSILGKTSRTKIIRNKISHSSMFYDKDKKCVVLLNGKEYTTEEFIKEYVRMFNFLLYWVKQSSKEEFTKDKFVDDLKEVIKTLSNNYLVIERSLKEEYRSFILKIKRENPR